MIGACERREWEEQGFFIRRGFAAKAITEAMWRRVVEISRAQWGRPGPAGDGLVLPESNLQGGDDVGEERERLVSKVFRLHRDPVFRDFVDSKAIVEIAEGLLGVQEIDCFLSQFIFKNPAAWGQPWHQDSFYFGFEPARPIAALWLAVSEATLQNGCLQILPGSQSEPVHRHVPDARPGTQYGYVEIVDHPMRDSQPCLLSPGDLMVFASHLMHRSTDNLS
ncbi:MAG: phytanoyl-CoA dioxygenase family protein, partial [Myxococcota bacterium]